MSVGCRIRLDFERLPVELMEAYRGIPSSNIGDMMNRLFCMHSAIRPYGKTELIGPAFTVRVPLGDNMFIHRALDIAKPGDVLVVDAGGEENRAVMGEIMFTYAAMRGIAGIIVDGVIRDTDCLARLDIPVYARGVSPQGPYKNGPGEINFPISCGGQPVYPGDLIVGDADGICVVPKDDVETLLQICQEKKQYEQNLLTRYHKNGPNLEQHRANYVALTKKLNTTYL